MTLTACEARELWDRARARFPAVARVRDFRVVSDWKVQETGTAGSISVYTDAVPPDVSVVFASSYLHPGTVLHEIWHACPEVAGDALTAYWTARGLRGTWQEQQEVSVRSKDRPGTAPNGMRWAWYTSPAEMFAETGRLAALRLMGVQDSSGYGPHAPEMTETHGVPLDLERMATFYGSLRLPTVQERIDAFWARVNNMRDSQVLTGREIAGWARNLTEVDPMSLVSVGVFRRIARDIQAEFERYR